MNTPFLKNPKVRFFLVCFALGFIYILGRNVNVYKLLIGKLETLNTDQSQYSIPTIASNPTQFSSEEDTFSITFPNKPTEEFGEVSTLGIVKVPQTTYSAEEADGTSYTLYSVIVSDLPEIITKNSTQEERFAWGSEGMTDENTVLVETKKITFKGFSALESWLLDRPSKLYLHNIVLEKDGKHYILMTTSTLQQNSKDQMFFDSFKLAK